MERRVDVLVVGAGPAGCAVALYLARGGAEVLLVDRAARPRDKACGEGLMPHGVAELGLLGLEGRVRAAGARGFQGIDYWSGRHHAAASFPEGTGLGVRRLVLDEVLLAAAEAEVELWTGVEVTRLASGPDGVRAATARGEVLARAVIGADGGPSLVRRQLGLDRPARGRRRYGARQHFRLPPGRTAGSRVEVHFGPVAELYLTPVGAAPDGADLVNLAVLCDKEVSPWFRGDVAGGVARVLESCPSVRPALEGAEPLADARFVGPLRQEALDVVGDRALLVGDAAGFLDPITGEGMSIGLVTARLAADTLLAALRADRLGASDLAPYRERRAAAVRDPLRLTELVLWWARQPALRGWVIDNLARHPESFQAMLGVIGGGGALRDLGVGPLRKVALRF